MQYTGKAAARIYGDVLFQIAMLNLGRDIMQYEFLQHFPRRMKNVGLYALLIQNSAQKAIWKQHGFLKLDEQLNVIFAVMLYIMEQSLKEEHCTVDDIDRKSVV